MPDLVHMLISIIPTKYAISQVVGFIKGKSSIYACTRLLVGVSGKLGLRTGRDLMTHFEN